MTKENLDNILLLKEYIRENYKSVHWSNYLKNKFDYIDEKKIKNFRNNGLSDGLDNSRLVDLELLHSRLEEFKNHLMLFKKTFDEVNNLFIKHNVGSNPSYIIQNGRFIDYVQLNHVILYLLLLENCFNKNKKINSVLEIGAGFGNLARIIIQEHDFKYFIIDLPEALIMQSFYLKKFFPEKKICFPHDLQNSELTENEIIKYDIFLMIPSVKIKEKLNIGCAINSGSFMEMRMSDIKKYFSIIEENLINDGFFFNNNRYFKDTSGEKIKLHCYPYSNKWSVVYSKNYLNFKRLHLLITKKINSETNDIMEELKKIKKLTSNHAYPDFIPIRIMKIYRIIKKLLKS